MSPDLNTLPPSPLLRTSSSSSLTSRAQSPTALRTMTSSPHSLAATAAMNAGIQNEDRRPSSGSMRREVERARRRSSIRLNLNLADPGMPAPGEMAWSPRGREGGDGEWERGRAPSLGQLHQELEVEQEGQVNRLLSMIRAQQSQINTLQSQSHPPNQQPSTSAVDDTPTSERSPSFPPPSSRTPMPPSISRQSSFYTGSQQPSPSLHPMSAHASEHDMLPGSATAPPLLTTATTTRDESAFYQAETQTLTRENQMLKGRIRDLERQLLALDPTSAITHSPALPSSLGTQEGPPEE